MKSWNELYQMVRFFYYYCFLLFLAFGRGAAGTDGDGLGGLFLNFRTDQEELTVTVIKWAVELTASSHCQVQVLLGECLRGSTLPRPRCIH